jgi:uncharacterized SAM-binding protein YcdF (DUF218 family)
MRRRSRFLFTMLALLLIFAAASVRLFVLPAKDSPRRADAIVVLGGDGDRLGAGLELAHQGLAQTLLVSVAGSAKGCPPAIPRVRVICFRPRPATTQGEARYAAAAARQFGWKHLVVISSIEQATRARLRFKRCTNIDIAYITTPTPAVQRPYRIAYEWAALVKVLLFRRSC